MASNKIYPPINTEMYNIRLSADDVSKAQQSQGARLSLGNMLQPWALYFNQLAGLGNGEFSIGTREDRLETDPTSVPAGTPFIESDTGELWVTVSYSGFNAWVLIAGEPIEAPHADRMNLASVVNVSGTAVSQVSGDLFSSNWIGRKVIIDGLAFVVVSVATSTSLNINKPAGTLSAVDLHFNLWSPSDYPVGFQYFENDTSPVEYHTTYAVKRQDPSTVNVAGDTATITSGPGFDPYVVGNGIALNGTPFVVAQWVSSSAVKLLGAVPAGAANMTVLGGTDWYYTSGYAIGNHADIPAATVLDRGLTYYKKNCGRVQYQFDGTDWTYTAGTWVDVWANLPGGLGAADNNFRFEASDVGHLYVWNGSGWTWTSGDGSGLFVQSDTAPEPARWYVQVASGGSGVYYTESGGHLTKNFPTFSTVADGLAFFRAGSAYVGTPTAATRATWDPIAKTDDESAHTHDVTIANNATATGHAAGADLAAAQTVTSAAGTAHSHTLSNANAKLNPPNDANGGVLSYITIPMWMRI